jgi:hypothetical protein
LTVLLIIACWSAVLLVVAALCGAARLGDRHADHAHPAGAREETAEHVAVGTSAAARHRARGEAPGQLVGPRGAVG